MISEYDIDRAIDKVLHLASTDENFRALLLNSPKKALAQWENELGKGQLPSQSRKRLLDAIRTTKPLTLENVSRKLAEQMTYQ